MDDRGGIGRRLDAPQRGVAMRSFAVPILAVLILVALVMLFTDVLRPIVADGSAVPRGLEHPRRESSGPVAVLPVLGEGPAEPAARSGDAGRGPAGDRCSVRVVCLQESTGDVGLPGVLVTLRSPSGQVVAEVETDRLGVAELSGLDPGLHRLDLSIESWVPIASSADPRGLIRVPGEPVEVRWTRVLACGFELRGGLVDARVQRSQVVPHWRPVLQGAEWLRMHRGLFQRLLPDRRPEQRLTHVVKVVGADALIPSTHGGDGPQVQVIAYHPELGPCSFFVPAHPVDQLSSLTVLEPSGHPKVEPMCSVEVVTTTPSGASIAASDCLLMRAELTERHGFASTEVLGGDKAWVVAGRYLVRPYCAWVRPSLPEVVLEPGEHVRVELKALCELARVRVRLLGLPQRRCALQVEVPDGGYTPPTTVEDGDVIWLPSGTIRILLTFGRSDGTGLHEVARTVFVADRALAIPDMVIDVR
jgi:hypothetical protein